MAMDFVTFTVIIDDIVYPDGRTVMASLGGGGPQSAFGARIWLSEDNARVGLAASVGSDFPDSCRKWLEDMHIDVHGLLPSTEPTLRAWQILEQDGRRTQVWRVAVGDEIWDMLRPPISSLPSGYQNAGVYHLGVHPSARDVPFIHTLQATGAEVVSIETYTHSENFVTRSELMALFTSAHVFSPNEKEAASLVGPGTPLDIITRLVELGAKVVALRRGASGSIVHRADTGETWEIPAFQSTLQAELCNLSYAQTQPVIDPTGCGNAYCGGFAVGWWKTKDVLLAGLWGTISASFMIEHEGVPPAFLRVWMSQAQTRVEMLRPYARRVDVG